MEGTNLFCSCLKSCHCGIQRTPTMEEIVKQNACFVDCNTNCNLILDPVEQNACYNTCACTCNEVCIEGCDGADDEHLCKLQCGCNSQAEPLNDVTPSSPTASPTPSTPVADSTQTTPVVSLAPATETPSVSPSVEVSASPQVSLPQTPEVSLPSPKEVETTAKDTFNKVKDSAPALPEVNAATVGDAVKQAKDAGLPLPNMVSKMSFLETEVTSSNYTASKCTSLCVSKCIGDSKDKTGAIDCLTDCGCYQAYDNIEMMQAPEARLLANSRTVSVLGYLIFCLFLSGVILFTGYLVVERDGKKKIRQYDEENLENPLYQRLQLNRI